MSGRITRLPLPERRQRDLLAARLVGRWFHTNPTELVGYEVADDHAIATIRIPLTPEEVQEYREVVGPL